MKIRFLLPVVCGVCLLGVDVVARSGWFDGADDEPAGNSAEVSELSWEDMVPEGYQPPADPTMDMSSDELDKLWDGSDESNARLAEIDEILSFAPTVPELDGQRVKVPGYIVPLDFDGNTLLSEFLVVPYFGACIHTPPPPANQVVHANSGESIQVDNLYEPVWAIGTLRTETIESNLAEAGYQMSVERVVPYELEE